MEMCRVCLSTELEMVLMDDNFVNNYNLLTNLNLTISEDMPLFTCITCFEGASFCIEFREKCIASDQELKKMLLLKTEEEIEPTQDNSPDDKELLTIKEEMELEYEDDVGYEDMEVLEELNNCDDIKLTAEVIKVTMKDKKNKNNKDDIELTTEVKNTAKERLRKRKVEEPMVVDSKLHCGICPKILKSNEELTNHLENNHRIDVSSQNDHTDIICGLCPERLINMAHLLGHRMEHLPKSQKQCHICAKKFMSAENSEFHYMRVHNMAEKDAPIQCKKCPKTFLVLKKLQQHIYVHRELTYSCNKCPQRFSNIFSLNHHKLKHGKPTFKCDLCDFASKYSEGLRQHTIRKHTEESVNCKLCGRVFRSQEVMDKQHVCRESKAIVCPVCGVSLRFKDKNSYNRHMLTHADVYLYKCDQCPSKFKARGNYKAHMDRHAETPRFKCDECSRSFYTHSILIKHRRTHTGEKPYVCKVCSRGFTGNHNLKVHMKVHGYVNLIKRKNQVKTQEKNTKSPSSSSSSSSS